MDYALETTFDVKFTSRIFATGVPGTLAGSPVVEIYEDNGVTQITTAETLTVDFDSVTGLNNLRIVATAANGFEAGKSYSAVISVGTVSSVSVVGEVVCNFSIQRQPVNWANVTAATTAVDLSGTDIQLCDTATTLTNLPAITANWLTATGINADAITAAKIADNALANEHFAAGALTSTEITSVAGAVVSSTGLDLVLKSSTFALAIADANWDEAVAGHVAAGSFGKTDADMLADTNELQGDWVNAGRLDTLLDAITPIGPTKTEMDTAHALLATPADLLTTALTEAYAADGAAPTLSEILFLISQHLSESSISSTTKTVKKLDGSTSAATFTLDSATTPTSITRAT